MFEQFPHWIAGTWEQGGEPLQIRSPFDGQLVGETMFAGPDMVERATEAAAASQRPMAQMSAYERAQVLWKLKSGLEAHRDEAIRLIVLEAGKPLKQATAEMDRALLTIEAAAEEAKRVYGDVLPLDVTQATRGHFGIVRRFPIGPILGISPFNFPLNLAMHKVAAALACGNPIVLKPSPRAPLTWLFVARLFEGLDLPRGALSVLICDNDLTTRMVEDERFKMVSFTGSAAVGWSLKARAGKKRVVLELGGNAAAIVDGTADIQLAARKLAASAFGYAGQSCISAQRLFVDRSVQSNFEKYLVEAAEELKVGDPLDPETDVGPMISAEAVRRAEEWLQEAVDMGAKVLTGGKSEGSIFYPTVLADAHTNARVCSQEVFAPMVNVATYDTFEGAVDEANDSRYGLQASVFTQNLAHVLYAYRELEVGGVIVNDVPSYRVDPMPYGGVKDSGFGREGIRYSMAEMTEPKLLVFTDGF